jgi:hypothetical protein
MDTVSGSHVSLDKVEFNDGRMRAVELVDSTYSRFDLGRVELTKCKFDRSNFSRCAWSDGTLNDVSFRQGKLVDVAFPDCTVADLDFTQATLEGIDLREIGLGSAVLLDAAFVQCSWPEQRGKVKVLGAYSPSPFLVAQPVQDFKGVGALLRRDIADSQYLVERLGRGGTLLTRAMLRLWGLVSCYGQSLRRLIAVSLMAIAFGAIVVTLNEHSLRTAFDHPYEFWSALNVSARSFASVSVNTGGSSSTLVTAVRVAERILGFLALGFWISIASRSLSRLSSE